MTTATSTPRPLAIAAMLAILCAPVSAEYNMNTTIQEGRITTNDTRQLGRVNDNATASAEPTGNPTDRPCFRISIQNEPVNEASVRQSCDRSYNRVVQAGAANRAQTIQTGTVNDNKVQQYSYDMPRHVERLRRGR